MFLKRTDNNNAYELFKAYSEQAIANKLKQEGAVWALMKVRNPYPKPM